jgi:hypothetical protein
MEVFMTHRVYISASTQKANIGVGDYGTEQDRMQYLADRIKLWLETQKGQFTVFRNQKGWTLQKTVDDCNSLACEIFVDNHTNADDAEKTDGTVSFYHSIPGKILSDIVYARIAPLSPGKDRGSKNDRVLYKNGLFVLRETKPVAILIEHFFHTNEEEVEFYLSRVDLFARAEAMGICDYFKIPWVEPNVELDGVHVLVNGVDINPGVMMYPFFKNGELMVPLKPLLTALGGLKATYDKDNKTIIVEKAGE